MDKLFNSVGGTLFSGDWLELAQDIGADSVDIIVTSPPYWNQKEYAHWCTYGEYINDVGKWVVEAHRVLSPGRHCFWVIPDKIPWPPKESGLPYRSYMPIYADTEAVAYKAGFMPEFPIIWKKPHGSQKMFGSYPYPPTIIHTPMTERICVWRKPGKYCRRPDKVKELSRLSKEEWVQYAQDVWNIPGETNIDHPAPFPIELVSRILKMWSFIGDTVLDPFVGSGSTCVAAVKLDRKFIGCDIHNEYIVDMAIPRITEAIITKFPPPLMEE